MPYLSCRKEFSVARIWVMRRKGDSGEAKEVKKKFLTAEGLVNFVSVCWALCKRQWEGNLLRVLKYIFYTNLVVSKIGL